MLTKLFDYEFLKLTMPGNCPGETLLPFIIFSGTDELPSFPAVPLNVGIEFFSMELISSPDSIRSMEP